MRHNAIMSEIWLLKLLKTVTPLLYEAIYWLIGMTQPGWKCCQKKEGISPLTYPPYSTIEVPPPLPWRIEAKRKIFSSTNLMNPWKLYHNVLHNRRIDWEASSLYHLGMSPKHLQVSLRCEVASVASENPTVPCYFHARCFFLEVWSSMIN